jgi:DNA-binding XRE family transcriptional regulator
MCDIHRALRVILARYNASQSQLARDIGVSRFHISNICNERREPSWEMICAVCEVFDVKVSEFIKGGEE